MNINNDYQKSRGQITSFPTGEIIEPNRKYLESNLFYPLSNFYLNFSRAGLEMFKDESNIRTKNKFGTFTC